MTDSIDLDDIAVEEEDEQSGNDGDWLWRNDGEADAEPPEPASTASGDGSGEVPDESASEPAGGAAPGIPATTSDPVGVPGNAGKPAAGEDDPQPGTTQGAGTAETHGATEPDDMTMALTYKAAHYFTDPSFVFTDARAWADWLGLVGDVSTPVIRKFQRENGIELDFFGGSENGPATRLAEVDEESMFFAERMVLVGTDADEAVAEEAGWEFVHLEEAAEKADWELRDDM